MKTLGIYLSWIVVEDIEKAIEFYTEVAGLQLKEYHKEFFWAELSGPNGILLGISQESPENPIRAGQNAVVTISVENLDDAMAHFKMHQITFIDEVLEVPGHVKMRSFRDASGNIMQLVQKLD